MRNRKYQFNPAYYRAHTDICKRRDTKRLYFNPLRIDLAHGRGAGATSFCAIEALLAVEKSVLENQTTRKPKRQLPYHTAVQNDTTRLRSVLVVVKSQAMVRSCKDYFRWAMEYLGISDYYTYSHTNNAFIREGTNSLIKFVTVDFFLAQIERIPIQKFTFIVIDNADTLSPHEFWSIKNDVLIMNKFQNRIVLVSYNPRFENDWLGADGFGRVGDVNYRFYHADFRSMPRDWLGESFFKHAKMLKQADPKAYSEEYLGLPYVETIKTVLHGVLCGKKKENQNKKGKPK